MEASGSLDTLPLWALLPCTIAIACFSVEIGHRAARRQRQHSKTEKGGEIGAMVGATLGLLACEAAFPVPSG